MLTKLPDCPNCLEDELWLERRSNGTFRIRCYLCGYDSDWRTPRADMSLEDNIATVVALAHVAAVKAVKGIE